MRRYLTKGDIVLVAVLSFVSLAGFGSVKSMLRDGSHAVGEVNGRKAAEIPLDRDGSVAVKGPLGETHVVVKDGAVSVFSSPCPEGYCMHMGRIRHPGEILVCVPNRVFVTVWSSGGDNQGYDGVSE